MGNNEISTLFFEHGSGIHISTIPGVLSPSLKKGSIVFLENEDHSKKDWEERRNSLSSRKWKVMYTALSVRQMETPHTPSQEWLSERA